MLLQFQPHEELYIIETIICIYIYIVSALQAVIEITSNFNFSLNPALNSLITLEMGGFLLRQMNASKKFIKAEKLQIVVAQLKNVANESLRTLVLRRKLKSLILWH